MRSKKLLIFTLTLLVLGLMGTMFLAACGDEETETTAAPTETTAAPTETTAAPTETTAAPTETTAAGAEQGEPLVIGVINSITGVNALTGAEQRWAQEKAAEDVNAKGGIMLADGMMHPVELKFVDDKSSDTEAAPAQLA